MRLYTWLAQAASMAVPCTIRVAPGTIGLVRSTLARSLAACASALRAFTLRTTTTGTAGLVCAGSCFVDILLPSHATHGPAVAAVVRITNSIGTSGDGIGGIHSRQEATAHY